jgi:hypothetical protein
MRLPVREDAAVPPFRGAKDMTTLSGSTRKVFFLFFFIACLAMMRTPAVAVAQETAQYTAEEYAAYQAIAAEADPAKKMDLILKFHKDYPKSALMQYITADFNNMLKGLQDAKRWTQIVTVGRQFLTVVPDDAYTIALVAAGYSETKNYQQFIVFGEAAYKTNPSGNLAYAMAKAYKELRNNPKMVEWAEKTVQKLPDNYEMLFELARVFADSERYAESDKYARQCLKVIQAAARPEQTPEKEWANYTSQLQMACYYIIGTGAFKRNDFANAIPNLENSVKINKRNDTAYYFLGESYVYAQKTSLALLNWAKASLLGGQVAVPAKQKLENLYKQTHGGSLAGLDKILAMAKAELSK